MARKVSEKRADIRNLDSEAYNARMAKLASLSLPEQIKLNDELRRNISGLYEKLLYHPPTEKMREVEPLHSPNNDTFWRDLDIEDVGRINVKVVKNNITETIEYYALEVGDLPIVDGMSRARKSILFELVPGDRLRSDHDTIGLNQALLIQHESLAALCTAAGIDTETIN